MSKIQQELEAALGTSKKSKESRQSFLKRLVDGAGKLKDDEWDKLSTATQDWVNDATKSANDKQDLPDPNDDDAGGEEQTSTKAAGKKGASKEPAAAKGGSKKAAGKGRQEEEREEAAPASRKAAGSKGNGAAKALSQDGVKYRIKMAMIKKPDISADDIMTQLSKGGNKVSRLTVAAIRAEFRHSLRVLHDAEKLTGINI